jgi:hypothetical protein
MDDLWAAPEAAGFFRNPADDRFQALSYESGERRTIACSFEFGGLDDGEAPSTKGWLLSRYCEFFGLSAVTPVPGHPGGSTRVVLRWNGPNPMRHSGTVSFALPRQERVTIRLYGIDGRLVRTVVDEPRPAGWHIVRWDARDDDGLRVAPGVYFCRLAAGKEIRTLKIVCVR